MLGEDPIIRAAYERAATAYAIARSEVYSRYPNGVPPRERLSQRERELLDDDEREAATLKRLRKRAAGQEQRSQFSGLPTRTLPVGDPVAMDVDLEYDSNGEPRLMRCRRCGAESSFDSTLPYVNQLASFTTGHECVVVLPGDEEA